MVSRKKAAGKARKAVKAKAQEIQAIVRKEDERNYLVGEIERLPCKHGADSLSSCDIAIQLVIAFGGAYGKAIETCDKCDSSKNMHCIVEAHIATTDEYAAVWLNSVKMEIATSCLFCMGVQEFLAGRYDDAREGATLAMYFEQITAGLKRIQAVDWPKIREVSVADLPTLRNFFRSRIPCSCLDDEKYTTNANEIEVGLSQEHSLTVRQQQSLDKLMQKLPCKHGIDAPAVKGVPFRFVTAFRDSFLSSRCGDIVLADRLIDAKDSTMDQFAAVWGDLAKMKIAISCLLFVGAQFILEGHIESARWAATMTRYFQQHIAVHLKQTQAIPNWPKIPETYIADDHTLVKFFRHRIPCSCLDEKYEEVKHITKLGYCYYPKCSGRKLERSKTKYCSRCRCATYCSRECQVSDWWSHKPYCDKHAEVIAKFEASQQNV